MIERETFDQLVDRLGDVAQADIHWAENECHPPRTAEEFATEVIFVICNSGMKNTVARRIFERVMKSLHDGESAGAAFGHKGKSAAIDQIWRDRSALRRQYLAAPDKLSFCRSLPWIGAVTAWHVAKNFGVDCVKPDVHLQRLANVHGTTPHDLCSHLAVRTGLSLRAIDTVLWRACADGVLDSRTGGVAPA